MSRIVQGLLAALVIFVAVIQAFAAGETTKPTGPTEETIKKFMAEQYTDMGKYATKKETLEYESIRFAEPREGNHLTDGIPANTRTIVHPIKIKMTHVTSWPKENKTRRESVECMIVVFKDEFGDWTFRLKENKVQEKK